MRPTFDARLRELLSRISFKGLTYEHTFEMDLEGSMRTARFYLRVAAPKDSIFAEHSTTGEPFPWRGRKWRLSPHMTDGEIVQTALMATLAALEHEARERFTFDGVSVFDPHYDIHKLVQLRRQGDALEERA